LLLLVLLIASSAFFSASETALMSLSPLKVRHMIEEKHKHAKVVARLVENPPRLLGAILVGNNLVNIGASAIATALAIDLFGDVGISIATVVMTVIVLIFAEITPKSLAADKAEQVALRVAKPVLYFTKLFTPLVWLLTRITGLLVRLLGGHSDGDAAVITERELKTMIDVGHEEGVLEGQERQMIQNVFRFADSRVREVMIPRTDAVMLSDDATYDEALALFREEGYSRLPVYGEHLDEILGVLHVKDLLFYEAPDAFRVHDAMKPVFFTYEFQRTLAVLEEMKKERVRLAVVLDEYGGTVGIVTMEDLVEEIVGELADEYDEPEPNIVLIREGQYILSGATSISQLNNETGLDIESADVDSIGGYITYRLDRLPDKGEVIELEGFTVTILEVSQNRILRLKMDVEA
jgi:putative hemolysin